MTRHRSGRQFLHTPGPTHIPDRVQNAMHVKAVDFASPEFMDVAVECFEGLKPLFGLSEGEVFIYTASGHGAWEAAFVNLFEPGDTVLMPETGRFSRVWGEMGEALGLEIVTVENDWRTAIDPATVEAALRQRRHRPMFLIDLAVPRDIEPQVDELEDVFLYTVDDLHKVVAENQVSRQEAAVEAEKIIDFQVVRFMHWMRSLDSVPTIRSLRDQVEILREAELADAKRRLANGEDPEQVLEHFSHNLSRKFSHAPSQALKQAGQEGNASLITSTRRLFKLKP